MAVQTIVFDFDGVIHQYKTKPPTWDSSIILDGPVEGIREAIDEIRELGYKVTIVSARADTEAGRAAIERFCNKYDIRVDEITNRKPPAKVYIDDRGMCFDGHPETLAQKVKDFKPWNR